MHKQKAPKKRQDDDSDDDSYAVFQLTEAKVKEFLRNEWNRTMRRVPLMTEEERMMQEDFHEKLEKLMIDRVLENLLHKRMEKLLHKRITSMRPLLQDKPAAAASTQVDAPVAAPAPAAPIIDVSPQTPERKLLESLEGTHL